MREREIERECACRRKGESEHTRESGGRSERKRKGGEGGEKECAREFER